MSGSPAGRLEGTVALVTGAGQGLGRAIAQAFGAERASVAAVDINPETARETCASVSAAGGVAIALEADVSSRSSVAEMTATALQELGRVDVVCNNAGILDGFAPAGDVGDELWDRVIAVNLTGNFLVTRAMLPQMLERGSGTFVNIASMAGFIAGAGGAAYTASKHGVIGLTRQVSVDYGPRGVRANAICPGSMDTEMSREFLAREPAVLDIVNSVPAGRQGRPDEVAKLAVYLASEDSAFMHGAAVVIDGGWTVR
jgi:3-oxoacyl-[acyl-carrier protein] reductase